ncbi:hypothetical protein ACH5RR_000794 [Cinchona calisaya]|uniref:Reverse transcriptase n=1 Tax=Cinchona calisaya TaxID=153742 RepID=A0ABD3B1Q8_9GENT
MPIETITQIRSWPKFVRMEVYDNSGASSLALKSRDQSTTPNFLRRLLCKRLKAILDTCGATLGQEIKLDKSAIVFSKNTNSKIRCTISHDLGIKEVSKHDKYLGLPTDVMRSKCEVLALIKDNVWQTLWGWNEQLLSSAGKEVLIKSMVQAIPTYSMDSFGFRNTLISEIQSTISNDRPIHWVSWNKLCVHREDGGMSFRLLEEFFWQDEMELIRSIAIGDNRKDKLVCHYSMNGAFTVKSAHHLTHSLSFGGENEPSGSHGTAGNAWKKLCELGIPNKVCSKARQTWALSFLTSRIRPDNASDITSYLMDLLFCIPNHARESASIILWSIGMQRTEMFLKEAAKQGYFEANFDGAFFPNES